MTQREHDALHRAETLLNAAARFILKNRLDEYTVRYDEAECDGYCLRQDIQIALDDIHDLLKANSGPQMDPETETAQSL